MDEWEIPLVVKDRKTGRVVSVDGVFRANKVHKRLCLVFIVMAFVGGGLIEIGDASAPDGCEEGDTLVSIGVFLFWTSVLAVPINGLILLASIPVKIMSTGGPIDRRFFTSPCWSLSLQFLEKQLIAIFHSQSHQTTILVQVSETRASTSV